MRQHISLSGIRVTIMIHEGQVQILDTRDLFPQTQRPELRSELAGLVKLQRNQPDSHKYRLSNISPIQHIHDSTCGCRIL